MNNHVCHHLNMDENYIFLVSKVGRVGNSLSQGMNFHAVNVFLKCEIWLKQDETIFPDLLAGCFNRYM